MTSTRTRQRGLRESLLAVAACTVPGPAAWADIGPPVKITMPLDSPQAVSGQVYEGVFEIDVRRAGTLADFKLEGAGWTVLSLDVAADPMQVEAGVVSIPFSARPADADQLIRMSLTYDGRLVSRSLAIGPAAFARRGRGKDRPSVQVSPVGHPDHAPPAGQGDEEAEPADSARGGAITVRFTGRIVYDRPATWTGNLCGNPMGTVTSTVEEGVHGIWVQVMDDDGLPSDPLVDEVMWSGFTDENGFFDTGSFLWDDCDIVGCDEPDLYLRYELDTGIVNVQNPLNVTEPDYSWSNMESNIFFDWNGSFHDFGTHKPANAADMPALHIHNSITRAHRFILSRVGLNVPEVDVLWPDGNNASYSGDFQEIKIGTPRQWNEGTHTHEYGHHFLDNFAVNVPPDYCNVGAPFCDDGSGVPNCYNTPTGSCGHCMWCRETDHDAYNEGWPNWLADVVTRSYADDYQFSDCTPWTAMCPRPQESTANCCQDGMPHDALLTEGFVGALLRDIEDDTQDDHDGDGIQDSLCLGVKEIFAVAVTFPEPITVADFLSRFLIMFPLEEDKLWPTAFNVDPSYVSGVGFGTDAAPPGAVTTLFSPTHPIGTGGPLPCITVTWQHAQDDVTGSCAYSYVWGTDPAGAMPDTVAETDIDFSGCSPSVTSNASYLGDYYFSIRAQDCVGNWSNAWAVFGPFTINECDGNGVIDVCDITCDASTLPLACAADFLYCQPFAGSCGTAPDCNTNQVPDDCDISSGTSQDCNQNGRPDECDEADGTLIRWVGGFSGSWHDAENWHKPNPACSPLPGQCQVELTTCPALPATTDDVCIEEPNGNITVVYSNGTTQVSTLACYESLTIDGSQGVPDLQLNGPSFINQNLTMTSESTLKVVDTLDVGGVLAWSDSIIRGPGNTNVYGGFDLNPPDNHTELRNGVHLSILGGVIDNHNSKYIELYDTSIFTIGLPVTYTYNGNFNIFAGSATNTVDVDGSLIRASGTGRATVSSFVDNTGLIHNQSGELALVSGGVHSGLLLGDPGSLITLSSSHDFLTSSVLAADDVTWRSNGLSLSFVRGALNIGRLLEIDGGAQCTITNQATVTSYGQYLFARNGIIRFESPVAVQYNTVTLGLGDSISFGQVHFDTGQPVSLNSLAVVFGSIDGADPVTINSSFVWNSGTIWSGGDITVNGSATIQSNGNMRNLRRDFYNSAYVTFINGDIAVRSGAVLYNTSGGILDLATDGTALSGGTVDNAGLLVKSAGTGISTIGSATLTTTGTVEIQSGTLRMTNSDYMQTTGQTILNGGDLEMWLGTRPVQLQGGTLTGVGTVMGDVINSGATIEPGLLSAGEMVIDGTFTQQLGGTTRIEIGGTTQGVDYDWLSVTAAVTLDGTLEVALINGFAPSSGQFDIITGSAVSGTFANLVGAGQFQVIYGADKVTLFVSCCGGDFDCDGDINLTDHVGFADCLSGPDAAPSPTPPTTPADCLSAFDFEVDGDVDLLDFAQMGPVIVP